jgi:putative hydrolase of the HAD superfamily
MTKPTPFSELPRCVLFDLDNTLYEYSPCNQAGMVAAKAFANQTFNLAGDEFDEHFAHARKEVKERLGTIGASHSRLLYFQRLLERAGFAGEFGAVLQMERAFWLAYLDTAELFPDVREFLDDLRIAGIPRLIVTDLPAEIQFRKLLSLELDELIDGIVTSEESGQDKPSPVGFRMAIDKIPTGEGPIWMIGDDADCDLAGAKAAIGALTIQKVHPGVKKQTDPASVDLAIQSFSEIRKLLQVAATRSA